MKTNSNREGEVKEFVFHGPQSPFERTIHCRANIRLTCVMVRKIPVIEINLWWRDVGNNSYEDRVYADGCTMNEIAQLIDASVHDFSSAMRFFDHLKSSRAEDIYGFVMLPSIQYAATQAVKQDGGLMSAEG